MKSFFFSCILLFAFTLHAQNFQLSIVAQAGVNQIFGEAGETGATFSLGAMYQLRSHNALFGLYGEGGYRYEDFRRISSSLTTRTNSSSFIEKTWYHFDTHQFYVQQGLDLQIGKWDLQAFLGFELLVGGNYQRKEQVAELGTEINLREGGLVVEGRLNQLSINEAATSRMDMSRTDLRLGINAFYPLSDKLSLGASFSGSVIPRTAQHFYGECSGGNCDELTTVIDGGPWVGSTRLQLQLKYSFSR